MKSAFAQSLGDHKNRLFQQGISRRQPQESRFTGRNPSETSQLLAPIAALTTLSRQAVADFKLFRSQIAHEAQPTNASPIIAAQIHNEAAAAIECRDSAVNVPRHIDSNGARKHRNFEQTNLIAQPFGMHRIRRNNRMLLGSWRRQLNFDTLPAAIKFLHE